MLKNGQIAAAFLIGDANLLQILFWRQVGRAVLGPRAGMGGLENQSHKN
jgi:hypothetical protein